MKRRRQKTIVSIMLTITILIMAIALSCSRPEPNVSVQIETPASEEELVSEPVPRPTPSEQVPRISIEELLGRMESNANIVIVDTRKEDEYNADHIKRAVSAPLSAILEGQWIPLAEQEIILYCS